MQDAQRTPDEELEQALSRLYRTEDAPDSFETGWRASVRREEQIQMTKSPRKHTLRRTLVPALAALVLVAGSLWAGTLEDAQLSPLSQPSPAPTLTRSATNSSATSKMAADMVAESPESESWSIADDAAAGYGAAADYGVAGASGSAMGMTEEGASDERKLVRTASVTLRTTAYDADAAQVKALVSELGGYVESLYEYGDVESGRTRTLSLSLRVPQEKLDAFLGGVEGIGRVTDRSESTTDMTVQYADNAARLKTLYDKMARLNELMAQAGDVSDLVEIENAIADTQYQIDSYETSQRRIDRRVDMSEVGLTLIEETPAQSAVNEDVSLGERLRAALNASIRWLGQFLRNMVVFLVMILPVAIPVAVVALGIWLFVRRRRNKPSKED